MSDEIFDENWNTKSQGHKKMSSFYKSEDPLLHLPHRVYRPKNIIPLVYLGKYLIFGRVLVQESLLL